MPVRIEPHAEPIPGYRLIERLGGGGFGEVWKAEAPGGLFKAIKFVYGEIRSKSDNAGDGSDSKSVNYSNGDENSRADQELKSLSRVKTVHHPYILSLERYDIIDNQLVIVMELADRTLWDRFKECRGLGLPGIPREELLGYMRETAEALDLMNNQFQLQHLDIKPQNLFLVFNHVKVADFGLVKDLGNKAAATITGGVTPVYAAPETFDGWLSRQCDQYSLAIVFQELLTGQRPFNGSTMRQLILQHIQGTPDLSLLPASDQAAVGKALSKNPDERFAGCLEFVKTLQATPMAKSVAAPAAPASMPMPQALVSVHQLQQPLDDRDRTADDITHGSPGRGAGKPAAGTDAYKQQVANDPSNLAPSRPSSKSEPLGSSSPSSKSSSGERLLGSTKQTSRRSAPQGHQVTTPRPSDQGGVVQPALVIGLGKMGLETLQQLRIRLGHEFGQPDAVPHIRMLGIDTDPQTAATIAQAEGHAGLSNGEIVLARLHRPSHYIKGAGSKSATDAWLNPKLIYRIPRELDNAGLRALGRLAFVDNYRVLSKRIEMELQACLSSETPNESSRTADLGLRSSQPRVYVVANLAGGTGSGMFLDVAYVTRMLLRRLGYDGAEIVGLFYLPPVGRDGIRSSSLSNTYASLLELNHFSRDEAVFAARYESSDPQTRNEPLCEIGSPLQRCVLLPLPEQHGSSVQEENAKTTSQAGDFLFRDLATPLGRVVDDQRREKMSLSNDYLMPGGNLLCQSFGLSRITWPRRTLLERCSRRLCKRLVDRWMTKDARAIADVIREHTLEQWDKANLRAEDLIERFHTLCEMRMKQAPERLFSGIINPLVNVLVPKAVTPAGAPVTINLTPVLGVLEQFDKLVGLPDECRASHQHAEPSLLESTLADASRQVIDDCEQKLAEIAVRLIEDPHYRLAGAEESLRQFSAVVEKSLKAQETLGKELHERSIQILNKIQQFLETPTQSETPTTSIWKAPFSRAAPTNNFGIDLLELIRSYPRTRYHALVLAQVNRLYVALRGYLSDQLREVGFCRQRLGELAALVLPTSSEPEKLPVSTSQLRVLLPAKCKNLDDALAVIESSITNDDLLAFDERMQTLIRKQYRALVQICMGTASVVRNLAPHFVYEAEKFLEPRFRGSSVAEMLYAQKEQQDTDVKQAVIDDLLEFFDESAPDLGRLSESKEIAVAMVPSDNRGKEISSALKKAIPRVSVLSGDQSDEIVFYREIMRVSLPELEQMGAVAQEAYRQRMALDPSSLHSREDITEWQPVAALKR